MTKRAKDTFFYRKRLLNCRGRLLDLSLPRIMGILNVTPDSFYDGGRFNNEEAAVNHALQMQADGASIIDVGGCSTRPGSEWPGEKEECDRVIPVIRKIMEKNPESIISIDTFHPAVAEKAVEAGAAMVNDISGGLLFDDMLPRVAKLKVPYVLMHMKGTPKTMQDNPVYEDVTKEVTAWMTERLRELRKLEFADIILDPGFGFGKETEDNYRLLHDLETFSLTGFPVLAGFSRKRMVNRVIGTNPEGALAGSLALNLIALQKGANILRVHDVKETAGLVKIHNFVRSSAFSPL